MQKATFTLMMVLLFIGAGLGQNHVAANGNLLASAPTNLTTAFDSLTDDAPVKPALQFTAAAGASYYRLFLHNVDTGSVVADQWFTATEAYCAEDEGCVLGWEALVVVIEMAHATADNGTVDDVYPEWGLLNGDYEWWVAAYIPELDEIVWSGGETYAPATFTVDVPPPATPTVNALWDDYYADVSVDYENDVYQWIRVVVAGNGEIFDQWYSVDELACNGTCHFSEDMHLPLYWGPGEYVAYAQAWGPGGFSSPDGSDSVESWSTGDAVVFPDTPPTVDEIFVDTPAGTDNIRIDWNVWENGTFYQVIVVDDGGNGSVVYNEWHHGSAIDCDSSCEVILPDMPADDYTVFVRSWGPGGFSMGGPEFDSYATADHQHILLME